MSPLIASIAFDALVGEVLRWVAIGLLSGTVLAAGTWVLTRTVLRSASSAVLCAVWLVVLLKFLIPVGPGWTYSAATALKSLRHAALPAPPDQKSPVEHSDGYQTTWIPVTAGAPAVSETLSAPPHSTVSLWTVLGVGYALSVGLFATIRIWQFAGFRAACRRLPACDASIRNLVASVCRRIGVNRVPDVRISAEARAPFVFGWLFPILVLSPRQTARAEELEAVVLHEMAHLRRGDLGVRYLQWLAGTLLFFWPVVAWVNRRIDLAREAACDEWALRHGRLSAGEYARCLLRAVQPAPSAAGFYAPAAMASNVRHVERRIDMILRSKKFGRARLWARLAGGTFVLCWGAFVLTGSAAAQPGPEEAPVQAEKLVVVKLGDGTDPQIDVSSEGNHMIVLAGDPLVAPFPAPDGASIMWVRAECDMETENGEPTRVFAMATVELSPQALEKFAADYPSADADGDGLVSREEHDAYLAALALADPAAVLAKYPHTDVNGDGALDAREAVRLVAGAGLRPAMVGANHFNIALKPENAETAGGHVRTIVLNGGKEGAAEWNPADSNESHVIVQRVNLSGDAGSQTMSHEVRVVASSNGPADVQVGGAGMGIAPFELPARWLTQNIDATPSSGTVAQLVPIAAEAPLALFLEMNPSADANHDGRLTAEERDAFIDAHRTQMRIKMLERFPEADANGDGLLTNEELHAYFQAKRGVGAAPAGGASATRTIMIRNGDVLINGEPADLNSADLPEHVRQMIEKHRAASGAK